MNLADYTGNMIDLPQHQAFLVIAAYIASFNPLSHDVKVFGSEGSRRKRRRRVLKDSKLKSTTNLNLKDALPRPVDMQRLLAIYHFVVPDPVPSFTRIAEMVNSLIARKYLIYANKNNKHKLKVNVTREQVESLTKNVNCKLSMYLKEQ
jgi:origin recognition complex subunit 5